jgi:hypothetical protein
MSDYRKITLKMSKSLPKGRDCWYRYMYTKPKDEVLKEGEFVDPRLGVIRCDPLEDVTVDVRNGRSVSETFSLSEHGFVLGKHDKPVSTPDLTSLENFEAYVMKEILPKIAVLIEENVKSSFRGKKVLAAHAIDFVLRCKDKSKLPKDLKEQTHQPVLDTHADFTAKSGAIRLKNEKRFYMHGDQGKIVLNGDQDTIILNVWQPIVPVVIRHPLVVCDLRSMQRDDLIRKEMYFKHRVGEIYGVKHSSKQKWYIFPKMNMSEALMFLSWTKDGTSTPHSGCVDPSDEFMKGPSRMSIETRWAVRMT